MLSAALSVRRRLAFSGGADATVRCWAMPYTGSGLYSQHGSAAPHARQVLIGHTDAVCSFSSLPLRRRG